MSKKNVAVKLLALLFRILEVPLTNLTLSEVFRGFPQSLQEKAWIIP